MFEKRKVYCSKCRYETSYAYDCDYEDNREYVLVKGNNRYPPRKNFGGYKKKASEINADNDCKWYKKRGCHW